MNADTRESEKAFKYGFAVSGARHVPGFAIWCAASL
jgi:hypothetical protein